jgi:membrane associated rhomboid family serine protease
LIFPILSGFVSWSKAPITWMLLVLNFLMTVYASNSSPDGLEDIMHKGYFLRTQGRLYAKYLHQRSGAEYPDLLLELGKQVERGEADAKELGELAFRDSNFLDEADRIEYDGDQVALKLWRRNVKEMDEIEARHPSFTLGLSARDLSLNKWVSYIFVHSGWLHFVGNMVIMMIYGAALEYQIGGLGTLVVFLLSGVFAAGTFAMLTGVANAPLVGASGAISGIIAMYSVLNFRKPARYFYWFFLPFRGYMGLIYLPAWVGLAVWGAGDLAGYLGTPPELGGVAHTAHLGGEAAGCLVALILFTLRRFWPVKMRDSVPNTVPVGVLLPFLPPRYDKAS